MSGEDESAGNNWFIAEHFGKAWRKKMFTEAFHDSLRNFKKPKKKSHCRMCAAFGSALGKEKIKMKKEDVKN